MLDREANYDLLRIICTLAVIAIHVSMIYKGAITDNEVFGECYQNHMWTTIVYDTFSRFAVPCFVMLTGAFVLADEKNVNYKYFYKKAFKSIGIQTIVFSFLYFLYALAIAVASVLVKGNDCFAIGGGW